MTRAEPRPRATAPVPGSRAGDVALAAAVLLTALVEMMATRTGGMTELVAAPVTGPAGAVVGTLTALAQAGAVLLHRYRPRSAYLLVALIAVVQFAAIAAPTTYAWPVLAFTLARAPGGAVAVLVLGWLAMVAGFAAAAVVMFGDAATGVGAAVGAGLILAVLILAAALAGRYTRAAARRADERRREDERVRRARALRTERARIAEEIGSGVLTGLHRLVALTRRGEPGGAVPGGAPSDAELRELREQARSVLAAMRRVLGILRAPDGPAGAREAGGTAGPGSGPAPRRARAVLPLPDRAGLAAQAAFLLVALLAAAVPVPASVDPATARLLGTLGLPFDSPPGLFVVALQFVLIAWWRTAPVAAAVLAGFGTAAAAGLDATNLLADGSWLLLVWGAATQAPPRWSGPAVTLSTLVWLAGGLVFGFATAPGGWVVLVLSCLGVVPLWAAGVLVRRHRLETEWRHRDRAAEGDRDAVSSERLRVARELHDVVAHHVSAIAVQAGAARMTPDAALRAEALAHVAESGRRVSEALPRLADLTPDPHGVALDADGVTELVGPSRQAGVPVTVTVYGDPVSPAGDADLFAQRILTEALTNTLRHAGRSRTRVAVTHAEAAVHVEVTDDGPVPGHRPDGHGSGLGLVGMRERVELLGGSLQAGPGGPGPGWTVRAVLPRTPLVRADEAGPAAISSSAPIPGEAPGA